MPTGPNGEKRPADVVGLAVKIGKISTGQLPDDRKAKDEPKRLAVEKTPKQPNSN